MKKSIFAKLAFHTTTDVFLIRVFGMVQDKNSWPYHVRPIDRPQSFLFLTIYWFCLSCFCCHLSLISSRLNPCTINWILPKWQKRLLLTDYIFLVFVAKYLTEFLHHCCFRPLSLIWIQLLSAKITRKDEKSVLKAATIFHINFVKVNLFST